MQANGLPWRVVDRALLVEQAVVLCHGVVVGTVLGAVLAWAILPVLQTSLLPDEIIPRTIVTLDPRTLLGAAAALIAAAAVVGWLAIRAAGGFRLADELRALA
jgi:ABC-type antimicrobial peptide transport system permease subunit